MMLTSPITPAQPSSVYTGIAKISFHCGPMTLSKDEQLKTKDEKLKTKDELLIMVQKHLDKRGDEMEQQRNELKELSESQSGLKVAFRYEALKYLNLKNKLNVRGGLELAVQRIQDQRRQKEDLSLELHKSGEPIYTAAGPYMRTLANDEEWISKVKELLGESNDGGARLDNIRSCQRSIYHTLSTVVHGYDEGFDLSSLRTLTMGNVPFSEDGFINMGDGYPSLFQS
ncbi:hypothetical protein HDU76_009219 [Blyttiomyces sp. JEL0837]|nr:hypothetical protein HDU76_009219 [Blyttiomyces sp. JEL0837]